MQKSAKVLQVKKSYGSVERKRFSVSGSSDNLPTSQITIPIGV
jgi:hypothetical protein